MCLLSNLCQWLPPGSISASLSERFAMQHDTLFFSRNMNPFAATCSEVGIDVCFSSSSWWYRSCNSYKVSLTICYRNYMSRNSLQTSSHISIVLSASDVADLLYHGQIHVFLRAGSSNSPQIWGQSCTLVNAVSWCTGQIFICAPLSSNRIGVQLGSEHSTVLHMPNQRGGPFNVNFIGNFACIKWYSILGFIEFGSNNAFSQGFMSTWNKFQFDLCKEVIISNWRFDDGGAQDVFHDKVLSCRAGKLLSLKLNLQSLGDFLKMV